MTVSTQANYRFSIILHSICRGIFNPLAFLRRCPYLHFNQQLHCHILRKQVRRPSDEGAEMYAGHDGVVRIYINMGVGGVAQWWNVGL